METSENWKEKFKQRSGKIMVAVVILLLCLGLLVVFAPTLQPASEPDEPAISITEEKPSQTQEPTCSDNVCEIPEDEPTQQLPDNEQQSSEPIVDKQPSIHTHAHAVKSVIEPTCLDEGYSIYSCACGDTYISDNTDALGHLWGQWIVTKQPSETENGTEKRTCGRCGIEDTRNIAKLPHSHFYAVERIIEPNCTQQGYSFYSCECGDSYTADITDPLGHDWSEWTVVEQPTEDENGIEKRTCGRCGIEDTRSIAKLPHSHFYAVDSIVEPTCTEQGFSIYLCKCGDTYKADYTDALGHDWSEWTVLQYPTYFEEGIEVRTCQRCGETEERSIDKLTPTIPDIPAHTHSHSIDSVVAPTCTEKGYTVYICGCGDTYKADYTDAYGHDWSEWTVVEHPTENAEGLERRTCSRGDAEEERSIDKLPSATEPTMYPYWKPISYNGLDDVGTFRGRDVWVDGSTVYYSCGSTQLVLNGDTWETMTWNGLASFSGNYVWTDGTNIYYSSGSEQYVLNGTTWETMSWTGLTNFNGNSVWTDGTNIYYSRYNKQYVLNGTTWEAITWNGLTSFDGSYVWTDGTNIYHSYVKNHYVLNGDTWEEKTWNGLTSYYGNKVWTDGTNIYYSGDKQTNQWKLDTATDTWSTITWEWENTTSEPSFTGEYVWTDGTNIYYSSGPWYYVLAYRSN